METTTSPAEEGKVALWLLINKKIHKVVYAEAGKDFVDFLFTLISLPLATVARILSKNGHGSLGCIGKISESVINLSDDYKTPALDKDSLLKYNKPITGANNILHLSTDEVKLPPKLLKYYVCNYGHSHSSVTYVALERDTKCPGCRTSLLNVGQNVVAPPPGDGDEAKKIGLSKEGYVKDVTYKILDDLDVIPLTTEISTYHLIQNCDNRADLEIKVVHVGMDDVQACVVK